MQASPMDNMTNLDLEVDNYDIDTDTHNIKTLGKQDQR